ncbi:MAG: tyrosine-type recombinase/integrase [Candidatus Kapabacteria bacterium]|nr:tyrosine-type recombinase/integrase [Candidatus Kapabacteria bacterium]
MQCFCINYYLQKVSKEKDYYFIMISVAWDRKRVRTTLGVQMEKRLWDSEKQRVKSSAKNPQKINAKLDELRFKLQQFYDEIEPEEKSPNVRSVKAFLSATLEGREYKRREPIIKPQKTFIDYFKDFYEATTNGERLTHEGKPMRESSFKNINSVMNHLNNFIEETGYELHFDTVDEKFFGLFNRYLADRKIRNAGQANIIKVLKTFMRYCFDKGIHNNIRFSTVLKKYKDEPMKVALNEEELKSIENLENLTPRLSKIRDIFLVQIYTGLRFSDLANLKSSNINYKMSEIQIYTIKTEKPILIPITNKLRVIFERYDSKLPMISGQKYNDGIKEVCKLAGIVEQVQVTSYIGERRIDVVKPKYMLISSHTARRSFITLSLKYGVLDQMIMQITGHSDRASFNKYIRISQKEAMNEVRKAWEK